LTSPFVANNDEREPGTNARGDEFASETEFFVQSGVGPPNFWIRQHFIFHGGQAFSHYLISLILLRAASIS